MNTQTITTPFVFDSGYRTQMTISLDSKGLLIGRYQDNMKRTIRGKKWQPALRSAYLAATAA